MCVDHTAKEEMIVPTTDKTLSKGLFKPLFRGCQHLPRSGPSLRPV